MGATPGDYIIFRGKSERQEETGKIGGEGEHEPLAGRGQEGRRKAFRWCSFTKAGKNVRLGNFGGAVGIGNNDDHQPFAARG